MAVKIAVTPEYADEKRQFHLNRLLLFLLLKKKLTALSYIFFKLLEIMHLTVHIIYMFKFNNPPR